MYNNNPQENSTFIEEGWMFFTHTHDNLLLPLLTTNDNQSKEEGTDERMYQFIRLDQSRQ